MERTLCMVKPNAVKKDVIGQILSRFESGGLSIRALRMLRLTRQHAESFYDVHQGKPFFEGLVAFMTSGPIVALVLEGDNAVARAREIMGATNPADAAEGTIRKDFADSLTENAVHGSDSVDNGLREAAFFFSSWDQTIF